MADIGERKLATIRVIDDLQPIEGADLIEKAVVGGWNIVVKKNEFSVGDLCCYVEIDSFLGDGNPAWQFLVDKQPKMFNGKKGHKLRSMKMRGVISQGFVTPEEKWFEGALGKFVADYFNEKSILAEMGILDRNKFQHAVKNFRQNSKWLGYNDLFTVFITEKWLRENF